MSQQIIQQVLNSPRLPTIPIVALRLVELCRDPHVDINKVVEVLSRDAAMTAKVLRTANSAAWSPGKPITTLKQAVVMLGLRNTKTLALSFCLASGVTSRLGQGFDLQLFWRRSLYAGAAAEVVARHLKLPNPEEIFVASLLQDIGALAMACTLGDSYLKIYGSTAGWHPSLAHSERQQLGVDHAQVGAALAQHWHLPEFFADLIAHHEQPELPTSDPRPDAVCCLLASGAAADVLLVRSKQAMARFWDIVRLICNATRSEASRLLNEIASHAHQQEALFNSDNRQPVDINRVLAQANEMLVQLEIETCQRTAELENQTRQLLTQSQTDPLTALANRRALDHYLGSQFAACLTSGQPLSLILVDVDYFKKFNDTWGHPLGDDVLRTVAEALARHRPEPGLAARYGGEEFALILPGMKIAEAARLAEQIRQAVSQIRISVSESQEVSISISAGVATMEIANYRSPAKLLAAADRALYAAKAAGRNCVRVLVPRPSTAPAA